MEKSKFLEYCIELQKEKVEQLSALVKTLNDSALGEDKCTAGDKHHTFRAQTQNEQEIYAKQLMAANRDLNLLRTLQPKRKSMEVESGSLVATSNGLYLIAISIGAVDYKGSNVFVVSPVSPIGASLLGKKVGDEFVFNSKSSIIVGIE